MFKEIDAPMAQLDRAADYESVGRGFESLWAHQSDLIYMQEALKEAKIAYESEEVPVGAVIVSDEGNIIAKAHNKSISLNDPTAHAEILALRKASKIIGNYRLLGATVYVTLEPCPMCTWALIIARVKRLVYGTTDSKGIGCKYIFDNIKNNHKILLSTGILEKECSIILKEFFKERRDGRVD